MTLPASSPAGPRAYAEPALPPTARGAAPAATADLIDRFELLELVRLERFWRDQRQWRHLAECYVPDSRVLTTWFDGTGLAFAEASRELFEVRGSRAQHEIRPGWVRINGDRAICESPGAITVRMEFDGIEVDIVNSARFHSLAERTTQGWRLKTFTGIYNKDTLTPVDPAQRLSFDMTKLAAFRPSYRFLCYAMMLRGYSVRQDLPGDDDIALLNAFYAEADAWLEGRS